MSEASMMGLDRTKPVLRVLGADTLGPMAIRKQPRRLRLLEFSSLQVTCARTMASRCSDRGHPTEQRYRTLMSTGLKLFC
jgi:hypothetical protein